MLWIILIIVAFYLGTVVLAALAGLLKTALVLSLVIGIPYFLLVRWNTNHDD